MPRILYVCNDGNDPAGGVKVIYRHVEMLREHAFDAYVMHLSPAFARCTWFDNTAPVLHFQDIRDDDLVVVPEVMVALTYDLRKRGVRYCVFIQNGYFVLPYANYNAVHECYRHAEGILAISDDTGGLQAEMFPDCADKILRVQFSVDADVFRPGQKELTALYMPRKLESHSANVVPWLASRFPDWSFIALDGMSEGDVALHMGSARIFLSFSHLEGGPLPPIEAAIAGDLVLGYPGWGGEEYWREPNFQRVEMGNLREFVRKFHDMAALAVDPRIDAILAPGRAAIAERYSRANAVKRLCGAMERVLARRISA